MKNVWDSYWRLRPLSLPTREPAYSFVVRTLKERFGGIDGIRTVELGAGRGDMSLLLARDGARVTLVDSSRIALRQAQRIFAANGLEAEFILADLFRLGFRERFEASLSFGLVEHFVGEARHAVVDIHRVGELAFVSVPNALCFPYRAWKFGLEVRHRWPYGEEWPLTRSGLRQEMLRSFTEVCVFSAPLSFTLNRALKTELIPASPVDEMLPYQLVGCGRRPRPSVP